MISRKEALILIAGVASFGTVVVAAWLLNLIFQGNFEQADLVAPIINSSATISLVVITILYVVYTREIAQETRQGRIQEKKPCLVIGFSEESRRGDIGLPVLHNIGNGPATEIEVEICIGDMAHSINGATLAADDKMAIDSDDFHDLSDPEAEIYDLDGPLRITGCCDDVFGVDQTVCQVHKMKNVRSTALASR